MVPVAARLARQRLGSAATPAALPRAACPRRYPVGRIGEKMASITDEASAELDQTEKVTATATDQIGQHPAAAGQGSSLAGTLGVVATRVVVPLWLLVGAVLKLVDDSPTHLPASMIKVLGGHIDLTFVLHYSVAVELVVIGLIWLLPRLARPAALAMLGVFFPVLVADLLMGASSCGCFGPVEIHPAITMVMDGSLFLAVLLLGRRAPSLRMSTQLPLVPTLVAGLWILSSFAIAFGLPGPGNSEAAAAAEATAATTGLAAPPAYYVPEYSDWIGREWQSLEIASFTRGMPEDITSGLQYMIFYRKDCEHCHELMDVFFSEALEWPTTAVAVPEKDGFPVDGLAMPCSECRQAELPAGCDWFFQTPVLVRLNQGQVECAAEVEAADPQCLFF